jgi:hypothetical protein
MKKTTGVVAKEHRPLDDEKGIHGVTFDGKNVWFARDDELVAFDPKEERVVVRHAIPGADAGTAFDGTHLYQLAKDEILVIDPKSGQILRRMPSPGKGKDSGMAFADGHLWIGQWRDSKIQKVDAKTGEVLKTLTSDRFVTGVSCLEGELWHGASSDGKPCELRHVAQDGSIEETMEVPNIKSIAGIERTKDGFWCAGENGTLRLIQRKEL